LGWNIEFGRCRRCGGGLRFGLLDNRNGHHGRPGQQKYNYAR
jgi:hypothetical protein